MSRQERLHLAMVVVNVTPDIAFKCYFVPNFTQWKVQVSGIASTSSEHVSLLNTYTKHTYVCMYIHTHIQATAQHVWDGGESLTNKGITTGTHTEAE